MGKMNYRDVKQPNYRHVGKYRPRVEAKEIVTGKAFFLDDFSVPHMLYGKTKRCPYPHARIVSIDTSKAEAMPGVRAVITHKNMPEPWGLGLPVQRLLLEEKCTFVGDLVALIAADTAQIAQEACDLIDVEYEQLPAVYDSAAALEDDAPTLYKSFAKRTDKHGQQYLNNQCDNGIKYFQPDGPWWQIIKGDVEEGFKEADFIAEDFISFDKMPVPGAPETPSCIAKHDGGDNYTIWASSQSAHIMKLMAEGRIPNSNVSIKTFNVGGSYGNKQSMMTNSLSAAMLALKTQRPVKMVLTKAEQLTTYEVRLGSDMKAKIGMKKDGTVCAVEGDWLVNTGAVADSVQGQVGVGLGEAQLVCAKCKHWFFDSHIAVTNRQQAGIVRGYGGQELNSCLERLMCATMKAGNLNPLDVFKKNYIEPGDTFIWRDGRTWLSRSSFFFQDAMQAAADRIGWADKWKGWNVPYVVNGKKARGVGMGVIGNADISEDNTEAIVRIVPDLVGARRASTAIIETDITESGMGTRSAAVKCVAEVLNVPYEKVFITEPGSKWNPSNYGLCGSRGTITTGKAVSNAAMECKKQALELGALYFKRSVDQLDTKDFIIYVRDTPHLKVPIFKVAPKEMSIVGYGKHLEMFNIPSCMAFFVEVEVDLETGHTEIVEVSGGTDIGQIMDPKAVEMQLEGGFGSACVDTAIFEESTLDRATGRILANSMIDYKWRTFNEFPPYKGYIMESQIDSFMFKALGIGEISGAAGASAVLMAISNAIGADVKEYPATPAVVLKAMGKI